MNDIPTTVKNKALVEKRREQIVLAAIKLFSERGFHKTTLRELSEEAGISYGNVYDYVGSKEDILFLIHQYVCDLVFEELDNSVENIANPLEKLRRMVRAEFNLMDHWSDAILLIYQVGRLLNKPFLYSFLGKERLHVNKFELVIQQCIESGLLRQCNARLTANLIKCMVDGWVLKRWDLRNHATRLEAEKAILEVLFYGLLPEKETGGNTPPETDSIKGKNVLLVHNGTTLGAAIRSFLIARGLRVSCYVDEKEGGEQNPGLAAPSRDCAARLYRASKHGPLTRDLFRQIDNESGPIEIYIHDLGIGHLGSEENGSRESSGRSSPGRRLEESMSRAQEFAPFLKEEMSRRVSGRIIYVAPWAWDGYADSLRYEIVKAGTEALAVSMARDLSPNKINVNCIVPGFIKAPRPSRVQKEHAEEVIRAVPSGQMGELDDVNQVIAFLMGDESKYLTGQVLKITGGME
jgi:AcrR family transcriptional regulator/NAD(P)-dependent dehydrogenase (short-subunit alcohol dehydrogenase family)